MSYRATAAIEKLTTASALIDSAADYYFGEDADQTVGRLGAARMIVDSVIRGLM
jgi:hypothetical protein